MFEVSQEVHLSREELASIKAAAALFRVQSILEDPEASYSPRNAFLFVLASYLEIDTSLKLARAAGKPLKIDGETERIEFHLNDDETGTAKTLKEAPLSS